MSSDPQAVRQPGRALVIISALFVMGLLVLTVPFGPATTSTKNAPGNAGLTTDAKSVTPPGALHIPITTGPVVALVVGDRINVSYQVQALNWTPSYLGLLIHFPTVNGVFPVTGGSQMYIPLNVRNLTVPGPGWFNASTGPASHIMTTNTNFSTVISPFLSTLKLSVMANTTHGNVHLAVRWHYSIWNPVNNSTLTSNWSKFGNSLGYQSTVVPGPLIFIVAPVTSTLAVGAKFNAELTGLVSNQSFYIEMEAAGTGYRTGAIREPSPANISFFNISILMQNGRGTMTPGAWLIHIHDSYGDILYSLSVHLFTASTADVHFKILPSACGPIMFNGNLHRNGTVGHVGTNQTYNASAPLCTGFNFTGWSQSGGGAGFGTPLNLSTLVVIRYNTTLIATYH